MPIGKIALRPYIQNPNLYITAGLLTSLENKLCFYTDRAKTRPEYQRFIPEIKKEIQEVEAALNKKKKDIYMNKTIDKRTQQKQCCICGKPLPFNTSAGGEYVKDGSCIPLYFCSHECFFTSLFTTARIHTTTENVIKNKK